MLTCINKKSPEYLTLKNRSGIQDFILEAVCRDFLDKYDRFPNLDELPEANSEPYLRKTLGINLYNGAEINNILEKTGASTIEEANATINDEYRDLEVSITPLNKEAIIDVEHRPTDNNFDNWTEEDEILAKASRDENGHLLAPNGNPSNLTEKLYALVRTKAFKNWFGDWENDPENASKVVDENGEPLVVYTGVPIKGLTEFSLNTPNRTNLTSILKKGIYFSDKNTAGLYKKGKPVYKTTDKVNEEQAKIINTLYWAGESYDIFEDYVGLPLNIIKEYINQFTNEYTGELDNFTIPEGEVISAFLNIKNPIKIQHNGTSIVNLSEENKTKINNSEGAIIKDVDEHTRDNIINTHSTDYIVFNPNQIKSAISNSGSFNRLSGNIYDPEPNGYLILNNALQKLASLYGIKFNEITNTELNSKKWKDIIPDANSVNAFIYNGLIYINVDRANLDAPIHEMMHMLIGSMRFTNPSLYLSLIDSTLNFPNYSRLILQYPDRSRNDINEEIFITEVSRYVTGLPSNISNIGPKLLYEISYNIKRLLDTILMGLDSVKTISGDRLFNLSLKLLAQEINSSIMTNNFRGTLDVEGSELHRKLNNIKSDLIKQKLLEEDCD